ncbi:TPA: hypothetical protein ACX6Q6_003534 [Photobacterium damselae]
MRIKLGHIILNGQAVRTHITANSVLYVCVNDVFKALGYTHGGSSPYISRMKKTHVLERDDVVSGIKNYAKFTSALNIINHLDKHCCKSDYKTVRNELIAQHKSVNSPF